LHYWWVNQKQTYRHEIGGGYLWSPKRNRNGARNQFYENMKIVSPGDIVFSYWENAIRAYGYIRSFGYDAPKPIEFGNAGRQWSAIGYRVDVQYIELKHTVSPRKALDVVLPLLPEKYSPLHHKTGLGLQSVYLASLPDVLGSLFWEMIFALPNPSLARDSRAPVVNSAEVPERESWEGHEVEQLAKEQLDSTERDAIVKARRGQGIFRQNISRLERACRITRVDNSAYLIASHIKPWRHASNAERLSANNGLMLAPHADFLFDRGFVSFADNRLLISPVADPASLIKLGIDPERPPEVGEFTDEQERFLEFHRAEIFRAASR
jgi:putative restriction endonuclease